MKTRLLLLLIYGFFLLACQKEGIEIFSGEMVYISFTKDATKDSVSYSFKTYPSGEIVAQVPVRIRGHYLTEPCKFTVSAVLDSTTLPESAYVLPEVCEFSPGQEQDTIVVRFLNNFEDLDNETYRLFLQINEEGNVKQGEYAYRIAKFYVSDKLDAPDWWTRNDGTENNYYNIVEQVYLGTYSVVKYTMFLDLLEEDGVSFDGEDMMVLKKYATKLKYQVEAFNNDPNNQAAGLTPLKDEKGRPIQIPVAG